MRCKMKEELLLQAQVCKVRAAVCGKARGEARQRQACSMEKATAPYAACFAASSRPRNRCAGRRGSVRAQWRG